MSVVGVTPKARNGSALEHEGHEDGKAAGKEEGSNHSDPSSELTHGEDAPVKQKDPDFDDRHPERPEHHEDIETLD